MVKNMKKINILYVISSLKYCGPVNVLYNIVKYLDFKKYDVTVLSFQNGGKTDRTNDFMHLGVKCMCLHQNHTAIMINGKTLLIKQIKNIKPNIIHAQCFFSAVLLSKMQGNYKKIATLHCIPYEDFLSNHGLLIGSFMTKIYIRSLRELDSVIACSFSVASKMEKYSVVTNTIVNGIDVNSSIFDKTMIRKNLNLPLNKKMLLSVGVLNKRKNPTLILNNFLNSSISDNVYLVFLGEGEECKTFRYSNKPKESSIYFAGNVSNVDEYLAAADIFISASKSEGMPLAVLEAMRSGLPLLLSDIEPHEEILSVNEKMGILFKIDTDHDLKQQMENMIVNLKNYDSRLIQTTFNKYFSAQIMSKKYQDIYESVLS